MGNKLLTGLTEEQIASARECKSEEELLELARKEGVKLSDEQLAFVSGGGCMGSEKKKDEDKNNNDRPKIDP